MKEIPSQYQGLAIHKTRSFTIMFIWCCIGLWGINYASTHRNLTCLPLDKDAACLLTTQRLFDTTSANALMKSEIYQANLIKTEGQQMSPDSYQVVLDTKQGALWLTESDSEKVRQKEAIADKVNAFVKSDAQQFEYQSSYPMFFYVLSAAFGAISLFLFAGIWLALRAD